MRKPKIRLSHSIHEPVPTATGAAAGAFDTSAAPDVQAAQIRNVTLVSGSVGREWNIEHAGSQQHERVVRDEVPD
jgi:hypothetical protein